MKEVNNKKMTDIQINDSGEFDVSPRWAKKNDEMRAYFVNFMEMRDGVGQKINELVIITHEENPDWTLNRIANFIYLANQDLDGLSKNEIYKKVTDENRIILDVKKTKPKGLPSPLLEELREQKGEELTEEEETKLQNNLTEEKIHQKESILTEESSITNIPEQEEEEGDIVEDQEVIYDDPQKIVKQYEETIIKQNKAYEELEQKYKQVLKENKELLEENAKLYKELEKLRQQKKQKT